MNRCKIILVTFVAMIVLSSAAFVSNAGLVDSFSDIDDYMPSYENVLRYIVEEKGVMNGTSSTDFSPSAALKRSDIIVMLCRAFDADVEGYESYYNPFTDVDADSYYGKYVLWSYYESIISGTSSTTFSPDTPVNRQTACLLLNRFVNKFDVVLNDNGSNVLFTDDDEIGAGYKESVYKMYRAEIIEGDESGAFNPLDSIKRIHFAAMLFRYYDPVIPEPVDIYGGWRNGVSVTVSWSDISGISGYQIRLNSGDWIDVALRDSNYYTFDDLQGSTTYTVSFRTTLSYTKTTLYSEITTHTLSTKNRYIGTVYNYFDNGYVVRYYGNASDANSTLAKNDISRYMTLVSERFEKLLDLNLGYNTAYYQSAIDICKENVTTSNIDLLCTDEYPHTTCYNPLGPGIYPNSNVLYVTLRSMPTDEDKSVSNVYWTGHKVIMYDDGSDPNRSSSLGNRVMMVGLYDASVRERNSKATLMHELSHQFGAIDHYHELLDPIDPTSCLRKVSNSGSGYCSNLSCNSLNGTLYRPETCIMNSSNQDIENSTIMCAECTLDVKSHLDDHHVYDE